MPEFQYWWSVAGWLVATSAVVSTGIALLGIKTMISGRTYRILWVCGVVIALAAWYANAKQAADAAQDKRELLAAFNRSDIGSKPSLAPNAPTWLKIAYAEIGQAEIPGIEENPHITEYFAAVGGSRPQRDDDDDWASAFVEWTLQQVGKIGPRSNSPFAWTKWGLRTATPKIGDVVILNFSGLGHVGFYFGDAGEFIRVLGGNQNDAVRVFRYPKNAIVGYRSVPE